MSELAPERPLDRPDVLGRRIGAALLDIAILGAAFLAWAAATGGATNTDGMITFNLGGAPFVAWLAFALAYYFVCEAAWCQTPGKAALGIVVVAEDGSPAPAAAIATRTLLRVVEALPFMYLLGFAALLGSGRRQQRLGDRAAHTVVTRA